jgi:ferredoxin, 2Fe-2S
LSKLTFMLADGTSRAVDSVAGESIMTVATRAGIPGIIGECGGEMSCATCHVHIDTDQFPPPSMDEADLLDVVEERADNSRLSCQLKLTEDTGDLVMQVPQEA